MAGDDVVDGGRLVGENALRDVRDALGIRRFDFAVFGRKFAQNRREKRRLPRTVRSDEADALARTRREAGAAVKKPGAAHEREVQKPQHGRSLWKYERRSAASARKT